MTQSGRLRGAHRAMIERLARDGHLGDDWRPAWQRVPRHVFLPDDLWANKIPLSCRTDPDGWAEAAYSEVPLVNCYDDGVVAVGSGRAAASSRWIPSAVARLLEAACLGTGRHILEVGTGSGWTAALMAAYAPDVTVISLEADRVLARWARERLATAGFGPSTGVSVVVADGSDGYQAAAPYQRVIATCAVDRVPQAWIDQTEVGGLIVAPWRTPLLDGLLLVLQSHGNGMASGGFVDSLSFMAVHRPDTYGASMLGDAVRRTVLHSEEVFDGQGAHLAAALLVPDADGWVEQVPRGQVSRLEDLDSGSWAVAQFPAGRGGSYEVRQGGPRRLWDEVEAAYQWWQSRDRPGYVRFGVTASRYGQSVWLDDPTNVVTPITLSRR